jgi:hypothetical protein
MPFVRRGLIEGVYRSDISEVPPGEVLQEMLEKIGSWVDEAEPPSTSPVPSTLEP